jgi:hypothetical protein
MVLMSNEMPLVTSAVAVIVKVKSTYEAEMPTAAVPAVVKPVMLLTVPLSKTVPIACVLIAEPSAS